MHLQEEKCLKDGISSRCFGLSADFKHCLDFILRTIAREDARRLTFIEKIAHAGWLIISLHLEIFIFVSVVVQRLASQLPYYFASLKLVLCWTVNAFDTCFQLSS